MRWHLFFTPSASPRGLDTLSLLDALPIFRVLRRLADLEAAHREHERLPGVAAFGMRHRQIEISIDEIRRCRMPNAATPGRRSDRKSTRLNSSHEWISYPVLCLKNKSSRRL